MYRIIDEEFVQLDSGEYTYGVLKTILYNMKCIAESKKEAEHTRLFCNVPEGWEIEHCAGCYRAHGYRNIETKEIEYWDIDCDCSRYRD